MDGAARRGRCGLDAAEVLLHNSIHFIMALEGRYFHAILNLFIPPISKSELHKSRVMYVPLPFCYVLYVFTVLYKYSFKKKSAFKTWSHLNIKIK